MELSELIRELDVITISGEEAGTVSDICYDSRKCERDSLFVAVPGLKYDGHNYISEAIRRGARSIIHEKDVPPNPGVSFIRVENSRRVLGKLAKKFFHNPTSELCLIGVTGTNGKTTVTYLLESILEAAGFHVGVIGTINYRFGGDTFETSITTPESLDLQRIFRNMVDAGITHVIMEVSSHALDLGRVDDCEYDIGIFTNLSQDHLDYHYTFDNYFLAKRRFFSDILKEGKKMIINVDDSWGRRLFEEMDDSVLTFGIKHQTHVSSDDYTLSLNGINATVKTPRGNISITSPMIGKFNLYNILASAAAATVIQIPEKYIQAGIKGLESVPGRLEKVSESDEPAIFVDYAHTEDALKSVLENLSEFKTKKIITVFGCGGDRDRGKRPLMGRAAAEFSDLAIVTSDNPRTENPLAIIDEIEKGVRSDTMRKYRSQDYHSGFDEKGYIVIPDRTEAINLAIRIAEQDDIVLIAGKGHEDYQIIGETKIWFDDTVVARKALEQRRSGRAG
ncbi:MAG: UDP-N-acetylmuramoyl-L-alanyl-D-glutamate--2,6-diaminopimelate ligase [Deltaproteobacteria bacterium]|nr:UDP-N-acetylmuramoyl-L-alanyl-D-glutamate--2,6-diaminopimelate ligase [Deltaproteobacteria bacterium]